MTTTAQITPALPYFAAMQDCDWQAARSIAADMGDEHVATVDRAKLMAELESGTAEMVLCRSDQGDGGWSLHRPGATDDEIASGDAPYLVSGTAEQDEAGEWSAPTEQDYESARSVLLRQLS